jgi:serine/threonine-protein kinase SRK2
VQELLQASFKPATAEQEATYNADFDPESNTLWNHAYKSDIWACGVVLYRMLFRMFPFENPQQRSDVVTMTNILRGRFAFPKTLLSRKTISRDVMDLLAKMFIPNPDRRITLEKIWEHPWFQQDLPQELVVRPSMFHLRPRGSRPCLRVFFLDDSGCE